MCGIFGIIRPSGITDVDRDRFIQIGDRLRHRGPDGDGYICEPQALLGMHRLSIMDVKHGWQPFWTEDGQIGVLGNGEIYNAAALRALLTDRGHLLKSHSDMEVIPHLIEEYGMNFVHQLRGMFALVIFDRCRNEVVLVRDRMGEKPLSFARHNDHLVFASEQSALVYSQAVCAKLDRGAVAGYLVHGFSPEPNSIIEGICKVPAGHWIRVSLETGNLDVRMYWSAIDYLSDQPIQDTDVRLALEDSVEACLTSDVPVGISLSGGLDSSLVASIGVTAGAQLQAFSVGYPDGRTDESHEAAEFARLLGIPFHRIEIGGREVGTTYALVCALRDEPISDLAGPALASVARLAREADVPVLLTGLGGDELFWGYGWVSDLASWAYSYLACQGAGDSSRVFSRPPRSRQGLYEWMLSLGGARTNLDLRRFMNSFSESARAPLPLYEFQYGRAAVTELLTALDLKSAEPEFEMPSDPAQVAAHFIVALTSTYLRTNGLTQVDRLSMAYSVESRVPLVDHKLVELLMGSLLAATPFRAPPKSLLRKAAEPYLPASLLTRPKKGFTPPVREWLRSIWQANGDALGVDCVGIVTDLTLGPLRHVVRRPIDRSGRVDQLALRVLTLELWAQGLLAKQATA